MTPERDGPATSRDPEEIDELVDEFGDRSGPDPAREPELELAEDELIVEPAWDDDERRRTRGAPSGADVERDRALGRLVVRRAPAACGALAAAALALARGVLALLRREAADGGDGRAPSASGRSGGSAPSSGGDLAAAAAAARRWRGASAAARASAMTRWRQTCTAIIQRGDVAGDPADEARASRRRRGARRRARTASRRGTGRARPPKPFTRRIEYAARGCAETLIACLRDGGLLASSASSPSWRPSGVPRDPCPLLLGEGEPDHPLLVAGADRHDPHGAAAAVGLAHDGDERLDRRGAVLEVDRDPGEVAEGEVAMPDRSRPLPETLSEKTSWAGPSGPPSRTTTGTSRRRGRSRGAARPAPRAAGVRRDAHRRRGRRGRRPRASVTMPPRRDLDRADWPVAGGRSGGVSRISDASSAPTESTRAATPPRRSGARGPSAPARDASRQHQRGDVRRRPRARGRPRGRCRGR